MSIIIMIIVGFHRRPDRPRRHARDQPMGIVMTTILGIVGSVVAGFLGRQLGWYHDGEPAGWIALGGGRHHRALRGRPHRQETRLTQRPARPVPARRKTGRPLAGRPVALLAASRPRISRRRLRIAPRPPPGGALGQPPPSALYRFTRLDRRARPRVHQRLLGAVQRTLRIQHAQVVVDTLAEALVGHRRRAGWRPPAGAAPGSARPACRARPARRPLREADWIAFSYCAICVLLHMGQVSPASSEPPAKIGTVICGVKLRPRTAIEQAAQAGAGRARCVPVRLMVGKKAARARRCWRWRAGWCSAARMSGGAPAQVGQQPGRQGGEQHAVVQPHGLVQRRRQVVRQRLARQQHQRIAVLRGLARAATSCVRRCAGRPRPGSGQRGRQADVVALLRQRTDPAGS